MEYDAILQSVLDDIDRRISENIRVDELACASHYSIYHFCRLFMALTGTPVMTYVTRRKLEYALYDLSRGRKIIDVAMNYGFETHAGFTKAFKKCFGYPPSLYRLHVSAHQPERMTVCSFQSKNGGVIMQVQIKEVPSFAVAGVVSRHTFPNVKRVADIPAFWHTISMDYGQHLSRAYDAFTPAKHGEFGLCFDVDENSSEFTYMLGVTFDSNADESKIESDMRKIEIPGGLYAIFTTPKVPDEQYSQSIADTWAQALTRWLPESPYEYDDTRLGFESYDERDHGNMGADGYLHSDKRTQVKLTKTYYWVNIEDTHLIFFVSTFQENPSPGLGFQLYSSFRRMVSAARMILPAAMIFARGEWLFRISWAKVSLL